MDQTFSAYSTFVTTYMASSETAYEEELMAANAIYGPAKTLWDFRETKELELAAAGFTAEAYIQYATWERTGKKAAQLNPLHARNLYERAVAAHRSDYSVWEAYQDFWRDLVWASSSEHDDDLSEEEMLAALLAVAERSTRHVPFVGESWAALMRTQELVGEHSLVERESAGHPSFLGGSSNDPSETDAARDGLQPLSSVRSTPSSFRTTWTASSKSTWPELIFRGGCLRPSVRIEIRFVFMSGTDQAHP